MSNETPDSYPFPLRLTERGETLTSAQLQIIRAHADFPRLLELQETIYAAVAAERAAEKKMRKARADAWTEIRQIEPSPLQVAYNQALQRRRAAGEEKERILDEIQLAYLAGKVMPSLIAPLEAAVVTHREAILAEREARAVWVAGNAGPQAGREETEEETEEEKRAGFHVDAARVTTRAIMAEYRRAVEKSPLSRFIDPEPRLDRPQRAEEVEETEEGAE